MKDAYDLEANTEDYDVYVRPGRMNGNCGFMGEQPRTKHHTVIWQ